MRGCVPRGAPLALRPGLARTRAASSPVAVVALAARRAFNTTIQRDFRYSPLRPRTLTLVPLTASIHIRPRRRAPPRTHTRLALASQPAMEDSMEASSSVLSRLTLDLRGSRFVIERETMMNLPESVLLCLFPNGLVLSRQQQQQHLQQSGQGRVGGIDDEKDDDDEEEVYMVDFDAQCLSYVLSFFKKAQDDFYGTPTTPGKYRGVPTGDDPSSGPNPATNFPGVGLGQSPLLSKQAIIVLREELEYFVIPPKATANIAGQGREGTDDGGKATQALVELKQSAGQVLLQREKIFTALQRNVNKENNMAEQHLIDMLCMSGFDRDDVWGFRALEPNRCCITSIALVLLKTGIRFPGDTSSPKPTSRTSSEDDENQVEGLDGMKVDQMQLATAQKLLLFWRKPARKCWWDGVDVVVPHTSASATTAEKDGTADTAAQQAAEAEEADVNATTAGMTKDEVSLLRNKKGRKVRVWARRVWTLELSLVSAA